MTGMPDMTTGGESGATGPITKAISQRRSHRRQWRIVERTAIIILDAAMVAVAFWLAHFLRYTVLFKNTILASFRNNFSGFENSTQSPIYTPIGNFLWLEIGIVVGLITI